MKREIVVEMDKKSRMNIRYRVENIVGKDADLPMVQVPHVGPPHQGLQVHDPS